MSPALREQIRNMPIQERLDLLDEVWLSLGEDAAVLPLDDNLRRVLDEEVAGYRANPSEGMSEVEFHHRATALREQFAAARKDRK